MNTGTEIQVGADFMIGTWRYEHSSGSIGTYTFREDNSWTRVFEFVPSFSQAVLDGEYTFDTESMQLYYFGYGGETHSALYSVEVFSENNFIAVCLVLNGIPRDGSIYSVYTRIE